MKRLVLLGFLTVLLYAMATSCVSRQKIVYFQDLQSRESLMDSIKNHFTIQPNDLLGIVVSSFDLNAVRPFNLMSEARPAVDNSGISYNNTQQQGYLVAPDGSIDFPVLGRLEVAGLNRQQLSDLLVARISEYVKDPIVTIRILNFKVSVLGEVARPGTYHVQGERLTLPEALGLAGDLTIFGRRDNVLVIRDNGDTKTYEYLDLRKADVLYSEFYYLQQNDVVYVEPNNAQIQGSSFNRNTSIYISIASLLLSVMVIIFR